MKFPIFYHVLCQYPLINYFGFHSGVLLKSSRFNHSCASNAELVWRKEEKEGSEIRAVSKIKAGDEVTINFDILNIGLRRISERQESMKVKEKCPRVVVKKGIKC